MTGPTKIIPDHSANAVYPAPPEPIRLSQGMFDVKAPNNNQPMGNSGLPSGPTPYGDGSASGSAMTAWSEKSPWAEQIRAAIAPLSPNDKARFMSAFAEDRRGVEHVAQGAHGGEFTSKGNPQGSGEVTHPHGKGNIGLHKGESGHKLIRHLPGGKSVDYEGPHQIMQEPELEQHDLPEEPIEPHESATPQEWDAYEKNYRQWQSDEARAHKENERLQGEHEKAYAKWDKELGEQIDRLNAEESGLGDHVAVDSWLGSDYSHLPEEQRKAIGDSMKATLDLMTPEMREHVMKSLAGEKPKVKTPKKAELPKELPESHAKSVDDAAKWLADLDKESKAAPASEQWASDHMAKVSQKWPEIERMSKPQIDALAAKIGLESLAKKSKLAALRRLRGWIEAPARVLQQVAQ